MHTISISILSLNEQWLFTPLTTRQQKDICKIIIEIKDNYTHFISVINTIILNNLAFIYHSKFNSINLIDKLIIILHLRCVSIGSETELHLQKEDRQYNYTYKFTDIIDQIVNCFQQYSLPIIEEGNMKVICSIPLISEESSLISIHKNQNLTYSDLLSFFVQKIIIADSVIECSQLSTIERNKIINTLPALLLNKIINAIEYIIQHFSTVLLHSVMDVQIKLNFVGTVYIDFIKFILEYNLYNIYQEIYALNKHGNIAADYIETLTSMERELYISFIKQENQPTGDQTSTNDVAVPLPLNDPLQDLDIYKQTVGG